jgi:hypothetical protein
VTHSSGWRRHPIRAKVAGALVGFLVGWLAAELVLAACGLPAEELVFLNKDGSLEWDCYCTNPRGYFVERKLPDGRTVYCVNHADDPPRVIDLWSPLLADAYKVVVVGDSFTWGLGVEYRHSYPYRLRERLESAWGRRVALSNHANVGRMITEIREEMRQALVHGAPDLCIYGFVLNDPLDQTVGREQPLAPSEKASGMDSAHIDDFINVRTANLEKFRMESTVGRLRRVSRVVDLSLRQWEWRQIHWRTLAYYRDLYDPAKNAAGLAVTFAALSEMNRLQTQAGNRFLVVIFPLLVDTDGAYPFADIHRVLHDHLREMGIEYLDLWPVFRRMPVQELCVHPLDRHPNELAHDLAADAIRDYLTARPGPAE